MKGIALACFGLACVGCVTTYRTAQGTDFHEEIDLASPPHQNLHEATRTLLANGAVALTCPQESLRVRSVWLYRASVYLVEGCGWRATYVRDCGPESKAVAGHLSENIWDRPVDRAEIICRLEIIGKVELPRQAPAAGPTQSAGPPASPQ